MVPSFSLFVFKKSFPFFSFFLFSLFFSFFYLLFFFCFLSFFFSFFYLFSLFSFLIFPSFAGGYRTGLWAELTKRGLDFTFVGSVQAGPSNMSRNNEVFRNLYNNRIFLFFFSLSLFPFLELGLTRFQGHPGWRIDQIQANIEGWMTSYKPDYLLIHLGNYLSFFFFPIAHLFTHHCPLMYLYLTGTNDAGQNYSSAVMVQRMQLLLTTISYLSLLHNPCLFDFFLRYSILTLKLLRITEGVDY